MDPRNKEIDLHILMYGKIPELTEDDITKQGYYSGDYLSLSLQWWRSIPNLAGGRYIEQDIMKCKKPRMMVAFHVHTKMYMDVAVLKEFCAIIGRLDPNLMMEDESMVWTNSDVVVVLKHRNGKIPLSYVPETQRRHAFPLGPFSNTSQISEMRLDVLP